MNTYEIDLKLDDGYNTTLILNATDEERARYIVMQAERCPERSILAVRKV